MYKKLYPIQNTLAMAFLTNDQEFISKNINNPRYINPIKTFENEEIIRLGSEVSPDIEKVIKLINEVDNINAKDHNGQTVLTHAVIKKFDIEIIKAIISKLIAEKRKVNTVDKEKYSAYDYSKLYGRSKNVQELLKRYL